MNHFQRFLVCLEDSPSGGVARDKAVTLARTSGFTLTLFAGVRWSSLERAC